MTKEEIFNDLINIRTVGVEVAENILLAMQLYADQQVRLNSAWNKIEDGLPEINGYYLTTGSLWGGTLCYNVTKFDDGQWRTSWDIVAWRPIAPFIPPQV